LADLTIFAGYARLLVMQGY